MRRTYQTIGLVFFVVLVQSCSCYGVSLDMLASQRPSTYNTIVSPTPLRLDCSLAHLTSPRGGLPNGETTFYWDHLTNAVSYRINIYGDGALLATFDAASPATNLTADVSWNAIGGQFNFEVEWLAFDANGNSCRDAVAQQREAPPAPQPPQPVATPNCNQKPSAPYC